MDSVVKNCNTEADRHSPIDMSIGRIADRHDPENLDVIVLSTCGSECYRFQYIDLAVSSYGLSTPSYSENVNVFVSSTCESECY
jgi:hypothetical protein